MPEGKLYLLPTLLADDAFEKSVTPYALLTVRKLKIFVVENEKPARKFLKLCGVLPPFDGIRFFVLNKNTNSENLANILNEIENEESGILSDAGSPGIADPGADLIRLAHQRDLQVIPLAGASSILLAVMAAGMNGQGFTFCGYLPAKTPERLKAIRQLEKISKENSFTQVFIETPYRNNSLIADLLKTLHPETWLSVAAGITGANELLKTKQVKDWKISNPELENIPCVFSVWVGSK